MFDDELATVEQHRYVPSAPNGAFVLVVIEGPDAGQSYRLDDALPPRILIGQSAACTVRLVDPTVSRRHAALELAADRVRVVDLGSTNGTYVDGVLVADASLLDGSALKVGSTVLRVTRDATALDVELPVATAFGRMIGASR